MEQIERVALNTGFAVCRIHDQWKVVLYLREFSLVLCDSIEGRDGEQWGACAAHGGGDICVLRADPHCCMVETNRT